MPYEFKPKEDEFKENPIYHPGTMIPISESYTEDINVKTDHYMFPKNSEPGTGIPLGEAYDVTGSRRKDRK